MHNVYDDHRDKLSNCIIVYGAAGLLFYVGLLVSGFVLKHSVHMLSILRGVGL
jgi:hypothetical protein